MWPVLLLAALMAFPQGDQNLEQHAALASAAMQSGDYAQAEHHNRAIVRLQPRMAEAYMNLGLSCYLQKKYSEAIHAFDSGLHLKPDMWNAELFLGISHFNLNQIDAAIPSLQRYIAQRPDDLQGQYYLGISRLALEQPDKAERPLLAALRLEPRNMDVLYHLAQCYLQEARQNPARRTTLSKSFQSTLETIASIDPQSFRLAQLHAGYYESEGKKAEAIQELEQVLANDPRASGLHYTLGCLYMEDLKYDKAREQFEAELQLPAPYARTNLQLGHVYVATERAAEAIPQLTKALQLEPKSSGLVWIDIGRAYRMLNEPAKAESAYEKAVSMGQGTAAVYYQLAAVAKKAGDIDRSRTALMASQRLRSEEKRPNVSTHP